MILLQLAAKLSLHYSIQKCNSERVVLQVTNTNRFRTILCISSYHLREKLIPYTLVCKKCNLYFGIFPKHYLYYVRSNLNSVQCSHEGMFIFPRCKSLTSKFFIEIYHNAILIICVNLMYCLLNVECYFRYFF